MAQSGLTGAFRTSFLHGLMSGVSSGCPCILTPLWACFAAGHRAAAVHPPGGPEAVGPGEGRVQRSGHLAGHGGGE